MNELSVRSMKEWVNEVVHGLMYEWIAMNE